MVEYASEWLTMVENGPQNDLKQFKYLKMVLHYSKWLIFFSKKIVESLKKEVLKCVIWVKWLTILRYSPKFSMRNSPKNG